MEKIKHLEYKFSTLTYELIRECEDFELRFYAWIKLWAINKSSAWPGMETIEKELGWSRPKLIRAIEKMEEKGRLVVMRSAGASNVYDITWYDEANQSRNVTGGVTKRYYPKKSDNRLEVVTKRYTNYKLKENNYRGKKNLIKILDETKRKLNEKLSVI